MARSKTIKTARVIGVDPSLTACAIVVLEIVHGTSIKLVHHTIVSTESGRTIGSRLNQLCYECGRIRTAHADTGHVWATVESPPQGARMHNSAVLAQTAGACVMGLDPLPTTMHTAAAVKRFIVPHWHGASKDNWARSGRTHKFKRSQPSKIAVASHLASRYGINLLDHNLSDAAALAVYHAHRSGLIHG